jgi:hypothetical protein
MHISVIDGATPISRYDQTHRICVQSKALWDNLQFFGNSRGELSLWRCGHSWVPDNLLLLLLLFWLLSMQQQRFGTFLASLQAAAPLTDSHGSCSHLLGLAFLCYFVEVVMMVNSVLSLLPMGSDETTVLHYALHL